MTITLASIYNDTLEHLGENPNIESENEVTKATRVFNAIIDTCRKHVLRAHDWNFAKEYYNLVEVGTAPLSWPHQYKKPNDMLKPRFIQTANRKRRRIPFTIAKYSDDDNGTIQVILTDVSDATMVGTADLTDYSLFSVEAAEALSAWLAFKTARQFTDSKSVKSDALNFYNQAIAHAAWVDAQSEANDPEKEADWIEARTGYVEPYPQVLSE